jgi:hypothetical protein
MFVVSVATGGRGSDEFYRAVSTIIPTLVLTLALTGRFFMAPGAIRIAAEHVMGRHQPTAFLEPAGTGPAEHAKALEQLLAQLERDRRAAAEMPVTAIAFAAGIFVLLGLTVGEAMALAAVASQKQNVVFLAFTCAALAGGFAAVLGVAVIGPMSEASTN